MEWFKDETTQHNIHCYIDTMLYICLYVISIYQNVLFFWKHAGAVLKLENNMEELQQSY